MVLHKLELSGCAVFPGAIPNVYFIIFTEGVVNEFVVVTTVGLSIPRVERGKLDNTRRKRTKARIFYEETQL